MCCMARAHPEEPVFAVLHSRCSGPMSWGPQNAAQATGRPAFRRQSCRWWGRAWKPVWEWACGRVRACGPIGMMCFHRTDGWFLMLPAGNSRRLPSVAGCIPAPCPDGWARPAARLRGCVVAFVVAHARFHLSVRLFRDERIGEPVSLWSCRACLAGGDGAADTNDLSFPVLGAH